MSDCPVILRSYSLPVLASIVNDVLATLLSTSIIDDVLATLLPASIVNVVLGTLVG
jgi:hypothetical protein